MKRFVYNTIVFIYLANFLINNQCAAQYSDTKLFLENAPSFKHLTEFLNVPNHQTWQQRLAKRQTTDEMSTPTPEDVAFCGSLLGDISCSTGLAQGFIDADLSCGEGGGIEGIQRRANGCAMNERGQFCSSALSLFDPNGLGRTNIERNCSGVLASNSCPSACRTLLEDFRSRLGCCINAYINGSRSFSLNSASIDYRIWNLCNVPLPTAGCGNGLTVNPPDNIQECTNEEYFNRRYTQNLCLPERGQPYINAFLNSRCYQTFFPSAEYFVNLCSMNANGLACGLPSSERDLNRLNSVCATANVSCTSNCRDSITDAKKLEGCCINFGNTSTYTSPALSYSVWKSCKVETPGFCESPLSLRGTAVSIMKENCPIVLITAGLMCHFMHLLQLMIV